MIDILYLAFNRLDFTRASLDALRRNTNWSAVRRVVIYDDGSGDGTLDLVRQFTCPVPVEVRETSFGSPVSVMNDFLDRGTAEMFAKIDSDVMVPPGWLNECLDVMDANPGLHLLGIEAMHPTGLGPRMAIDAEFIGGIGLMRASAFPDGSRMEPHGRFGFTAYQQRRPWIRKAWLNPAIPVCLLDRVPFAPWCDLNGAYVAKGWQRPWEPYTQDQSALWEWWAK